MSAPATFPLISAPAGRVAQLQDVSGAADAVTSLGVTLRQAPRVGSVLVACVALASSSVSVASVGQSGVVWSHWFAQGGSGVTALTYLGVVTSAAAGLTATITLSGSASVAADIAEWSGLDTAALSLATSAGVSGTAQVADTGTVTPATVPAPNGLTAYPQGLVIAFTAWLGGGAALAATGPTNGFTSLAGGGTTTIGMGAGWLNQTPPPPTYEYWVSPGGQDTNPGTQAMPWATIGQAINAVKTLALGGTTGVTVHVGPGVYTISTQLVSTKNGLPTAPVTYVSDTKGAAIINSSYAGALWDLTGAYTTLSGFALTGFYALNGIKVEASSCVVADCDLYGLPQTGIYVASGALSRITRCRVNGVGSSGGTYAAILLGSPFNLVDSNLIGPVVGNGIVCTGTSAQQVIAGNTIFACTGASGVGIQTGCSSGVSDYGLVASNIVRNCVTGIAEAVTGSGSSGTHNQYLNNDVYSCTTAYALLNGLTPSGGITSDPLMVNYQANGSGDYHLTASSPCIGAATATGASDLDYDHHTRPSGAGYDMGAYEYGAVAGDTLRAAWTLNATGVPYAGLIGVLAPLTQPTGTGSGFYRAGVMSANPLVCFRLNEAAGVTNVADSSGHGYTGALSATGVTPGQAGMLTSDPQDSGGATLFDGATGAITTTYQPGALASFAVKFWTSYGGVSATGSYPRILGTDLVSSSKAGFEVLLTSNRTAITVTAGNGTTVATINSPVNTLLPFTRTQIVMSFSGGTLSLYVNGVLTGTAALTGFVAAATNPLRIGAAIAYSGDYYGGLIQEVAVYPSLSAAQVAADYLAGRTGPAVQQSASQYAFKQQMVMVYAPSGAFIDVWRDAPLLAGVKYSLDSATTPLRVTLPRAFDDFDEAGTPGARGSIGQGNIVQYWLFGPGLPSTGLLKYQGVIDSYAPAIAESGEESVTVTITPFDSVVGDNGLLGSQTFGTPNVPASYVDPISIIAWFFANNDPLTGLPYAHPLTLDPTNPASSGVAVQYTCSNQQLASIFNTALQMLPANWYWRVNPDKSVTLNVPPLTAQHQFVLGQHIVAPQYRKDWTGLKNVVQVQGNGLMTALTTGLTNGSPYTSLAVAPLPVALAVGQQLVINDNGNPVQSVTVSAAAAQGALTVSVTSFTANGTYPAQTQVAIYISATASGSDLATFGKRAMQLADNRVTDQTTALTLAQGLLTQYDRMVLRTKIRIVDYRGDARTGVGYDIETIEPGDTCQIVNPVNEASANLWDVAQWDVASWDYTPSATLQQVAIIFSVTYGFDFCDLELGYFLPEDTRDLTALRVKFQDFTLGA